MTLLLWALVAIVVIGGSFVAIKGRENTLRMLAGDPAATAQPMPLRRSSRPHDALLCTPGLCEGIAVDAPLPQYAMTPAALIAAIGQTIENSGLDHERIDDGTDPAVMRIITRSAFFRFPDVHFFQAVPLGDGSTGLIAYARAQIGYSDLGANLKRLKRLTADLPAMEESL